MTLLSGIGTRIVQFLTISMPIYQRDSVTEQQRDVDGVKVNVSGCVMRCFDGLMGPRTNLTLNTFKTTFIMEILISLSLREWEGEEKESE